MRQQELEVEELIEQAMRSKSTHLDLESYQLTTLPKSLASLTNLTHLNLDLALLDDLSILQKIPNLSTVPFRGAALPRRYWTKTTEWQPIWFLDEKNYRGRRLLFQKFGLDRIFTDLAASVSHPIELNLSNLGLTTVPDSIGNLINLTTLDLRKNQLTTIPDSISNLSNLTILDLSENQLTTIPGSIGNLVNLKKLCLENNKISSVSDIIGNLSNLTELYLDKNKLTTISENIGSLTNLRSLNLACNRLVSIPDTLCGLVNLKVLYLDENELIQLPHSIGNLIQLTSIGLSCNQLIDLPESFGDLINLEGELQLYENKLSALPDSISNLSKITQLTVDYNNLNTLPDNIGNLINLTYIMLESNQLASLPESMADLRSLTEIELCVNPLEDLSILQSLPQLEVVGCFGVELPRRYWTKLSEWKPEWLLDEENSEIRRLLILACGYETICQKLNAIELDTWREYTLLKIDAEVDVEPMVLLKMTCPSTAHIHILRVPPEMTSAESAITWVNHGIHPDAFAVQT